ncbi:MAG: succinate dehydrogenase/fumarate reductase iron-sulfur subunit [Acidimicrobiaceae bacterium]|nr:succinate dehydrogenase/fumarate reductase iron-sulfur subunit [Acidimicrobiaceae bacterium]
MERSEQQVDAAAPAPGTATALGTSEATGTGAAAGTMAGAVPAVAGATGDDAASERTVTMRVWRGDDEGGGLVDYTLPALEGEVVLDVIHRIQAETAPDLAVRWNCKAGKCGSCSAEINGRPRLLCMTRMSALPQDEPITVSPMRGFPVMRDLVTDVSYNFAVARTVPAFTPGPREADGTRRMFQKDVERSQEFRKCIECFLCQNVCHVIRDHEENKTRFAGPRFFARLAELEMHPLDVLDRRRYISEQMGIGMCNITKCCTEVCPEGIHITDNAIIPLKERVVDVRYDPVLWLGRKLFGRREPLASSAVASKVRSESGAVVPDSVSPAEPLSGGTFVPQNRSGEPAGRED